MSGRTQIGFRQQNKNCSDFDVVLTGSDTPAFRILLPELISVSNVALTPFGVEGVLHTIPGRWERSGQGLRGEFTVGRAFLVSARLAPRATMVDVDLAIKNLTDMALENVRADVCLSPNHLPGDGGHPGWSNDDFLACDVVDRSVQGTYWYEKRAPKCLKAWSGGRWVATHPHPDNPSADKVPPYPARPVRGPDSSLYAVESEDGRSLLFQAWNAPCHAAPPFPGNACFHLRPLVAALLEPGAEASVQGRAGIFEGRRDELLSVLTEFGIQ